MCRGHGKGRTFVRPGLVFLSFDSPLSSGVQARRLRTARGAWLVSAILWADFWRGVLIGRSPQTAVRLEAEDHLLCLSGGSPYGLPPALREVNHLPGNSDLFGPDLPLTDGGDPKKVTSVKYLPQGPH